MRAETEIEENYLQDLFGPVKAQILTELSYSPLTMDELSRLLNINKNAVKEHADSLEVKGYVISYFRHAQAGRPKKVIELSEKGLELFPKKYSILANLMLQEIKKQYGNEALNNILAGVAENMLKSYEVKGLDLEGSKRDKRMLQLKSFVDSLNRMGYSAKLEVDGDSMRIIRYNCIFYDLARENSGSICGTLGNQLVKKAIGDNFAITEKFSTGDKKCVVELKF